MNGSVEPRSAAVLALSALAVSCSSGSASAILYIEARNWQEPRQRGLTVTQVNTGPVPLWLNGRLLAGDRRSRSDPDHELWYDIVGPDGVRREYQCFSKRIAEAPSYVRLDVGERRRSDISIRCFDFEQPGLYVIVAHYQDRNARPPAAPQGAVHWKRELVSQPLVIAVEVAR